ncbi:hypothetical protein HDU89_007740 [Geranomyces variabilis]|nr:hypothetical protein HDU89_007740 [Geranomyces variabilis]
MPDDSLSDHNPPALTSTSETDEFYENDGDEEDSDARGAPRFDLSTDGPLFFTHFSIIIVCGITLILGKNGTVRVSEEYTCLKPSIVAFCVGIVVQIALIAPLELARRIAQLWFWRELTVTGMSFRSMMCTWSVIYSNSYRGAEDLLKGVGPISAFLMLVYLLEVAVVGAIGSLYQTTDVTILKASGILPLVYPLQDSSKSLASATVPVELASRAFLNFVKAYDPMTLEGLVYGNGTCHSTGDVPAAGAEKYCSAVVLSPLTGLRLTLSGEAKPNPIVWTPLAEGDTIEAQSTILEANVECRPSHDDIWWGSVSDPSEVYLFMNVTLNGAVETRQSYFQLYTAETSNVTTPQVQTVMFTEAGSNDPVVDDSGALLFGILALNFDDYGATSPLTLPLRDGPGTRDVGMLLCSAQLGLSTADTIFEVTQMDPACQVNLRSASDGSRTPYPMTTDTNYGYASALYLFQTLYVMTCDILPCVLSGNSPPVFDILIGLLAPSTDADGKQVFKINVPQIASSLSQLIARLMTGFAAAPAFPTDLTPPITAATTEARVFQTGVVKQVFTSPVCNIVLSIGAASALLVMLLLALGGRQWRLGGSTESVYLLLQALPAQKLPNISAKDWRDAHLGKIKDAARSVHVKGVPDGKRMRLTLSSNPRKPDKRAAKKGETLPAVVTASKETKREEV